MESIIINTKSGKMWKKKLDDKIYKIVMVEKWNSQLSFFLIFESNLLNFKMELIKKIPF